MAFNQTRMTAYALVSAMEEDLRECIRFYIGERKDLESLLNVELKGRAISRLEKDLDLAMTDYEIKDLVDYFDLGDTFQTINSNKDHFPADIVAQVKSHTLEFERIVPIRNRVMHIRPLNLDDLPTIADVCKQLATENNKLWGNIKTTIDRIEYDPNFVFNLQVKSYDEEPSVTHNLPLPDFDETGLIGRDKVVKQVKALCLGNFPIISIVGEGGIGKTALALKVAYELLEDDSNAFDALIWVSSKTTQLSTNEIIEIKGAIKDSLGVFQEISTIIGNKNTNEITEIIEYMSTFRIALFMDNLETIMDQTVREFVSSIPSGSKLIITSRIGLGAFEYPIKLYGIDESFASQLLRVYSRIRGVSSLLMLEEKTVRTYVNRMHRNPSYIKWFVNSVIAGAAPENILQDSDLFLEYCMTNVYEYLSSDAKELSAIFQCALGPRDLPELSYLTGFESIRLQKAVQELLSTNMLVESSKTKGVCIKAMYQLSELSQLYLNKHHKPSLEVQRGIRDNRNRLNALFEQQMANRSPNKYNSKKVKFRDKEDRVIVKMLYDVITEIRFDHYGEAFDLLKEARRLAPDYYEVARVFAYYYKVLGNFGEARQEFELAIRQSPDSPQLYYWFGKFLLHDENDVDASLIQFQRASELDPNSDEVLLAIARNYMYMHDFLNAMDVYEKVKKRIDHSDDYLSKIFFEIDLQISYRMADDAAIAGKVSESISHLHSMQTKYESTPEKHLEGVITTRLGKAYQVLAILNRYALDDQINELQEIQIWLDDKLKRF